MSGLAAASIYWPAGFTILARPRFLKAPLLAATPQGDLFVGGCNIPAWVKDLRAQQSPSSPMRLTAAVDVCPQFAIEHFRPNVETSTIYSLDNPNSRFEPIALAARAANDVYFAASESLFAQETHLVHYDGTQWVPTSVPTEMRNTIAMALTPRALWLLALRAEPGRARGLNDLALWRMDRHGQTATWNAISLPRDAKPTAIAAVGTSVWVSAVVLDEGSYAPVYELTE
ncbi:hypothetical protein [Polyangium aurulentum]|uniref:hypothetical protein n=1 Tax=Polyangium aurulentum TaxID=2567896 RepID=UPI0010ADF7A4|nr:hypothetical protein [Polyangium aurulentum]UQA60388.1 hypothetical protein E8A73_007915 [Polyangium aurulentum]